MTRRPMPRAVGWSLVLWALVVLGEGDRLGVPANPSVRFGCCGYRCRLASWCLSQRRGGVLRKMHLSLR